MIRLRLAVRLLRLAEPAILAPNPACSAILAIRSTDSSRTCSRRALRAPRFADPANPLRLALLALPPLRLAPLPLPRLAPPLATEL